MTRRRDPPQGVKIPIALQIIIVVFASVIACLMFWFQNLPH